MPLTLAHPAAVLPAYRFRHRGLPFVPLLIGSVTPDFEYFFNLEPRGHFSHSIPGVFLFCLPVGLALFGIYSLAIKPALPGILPRSLQARWDAGGPVTARPWYRCGIEIAVAVVLGAFTHVLWDGFTHHDGAAVDHWPGLRAAPLGLPWYKLLQHGSTLAGVLALSTWIYRQPLRARPVGPGPTGGDLFVTAVAFGLCFTAFAALKAPVRAGIFVVEVINAGMLALLAGCLWHRWRLRCRRL